MIVRSRTKPAFGSRFRLLLVAGFAGAILLGFLLLALPVSNADGAWHPGMRHFFVATSAVCVTGLDPLGVDSALTAFGLFALVLLVQAGALGIMTLGTFLILAAGRSLSVDEERSVMHELGPGKPREIRGVVRGAIFFTLGWEAAGALFMALRLHAAHGLPAARAAGQGVFFSVMSFCNAGFSLLPGSFGPFLRDPAMLVASGLLALAGGVGYMVHTALLALRPWRRDRLARGRLTLHARIVLEGLEVLLLAGLPLYLALEWNGAWAGLSPGNKVAAAFFRCFSSRASGFAEVPVESFRPATLLFTSFVMFVGAAPGSLGGGVKTTTIWVLAATMASTFRARQVPELHGRTVPRSAASEAVSILLLGLGVVGLLSFSLLLSETGPSAPSASRLFFESVSAFSNNGMSVGGTTARLSSPGLFATALAMFAGRLGPATLVLTLFRPHRTDFSKRYPEEVIAVG